MTSSFDSVRPGSVQPGSVRFGCAVWLVLFCCLLSHAQGRAQDQPPPQSMAAQPALRTESNVVLVPALVRDRKGALVDSLRASDFRITDDGVVQQPALDESSGVGPLALVIAVQVGGLGRGKLANYEKLDRAIKPLIDDVPHQVAVVVFDSTPRLAAGFTSDGDLIASALDGMEPGDKGASILDGLNFSADLLRQAPPNYRRAILLLSETVDRGSDVSINEALPSVSNTNAAIYALSFSSGKSAAANYGFHELPVHKTDDGGIAPGNAYPNPPHGCMGKDPDPDATTNKAVQAYDCLTQLAPPLALAKMAAIRAVDAKQRNVPQTVAELSGGEYLKSETSVDIANGLQMISSHLPYRYLLSFQAQSPHTGYHVVVVKIRDRPKLLVQVRSGYWADAGIATSAKP
jgi:hypothetical protein